jgi:tetraacyldisaccharide 4'-kinase
LSPGPSGAPQPVLNLIAPLYGRAAAARRRWYARRPDARRRLVRPVISVGNLVVGGSGKTPTVASLARWLVAEGERPSILTRGYARQIREEGVVVVSDRERVLEPVMRSGDEPQMLARALPGVPVLVGSDRYLAGVLAERRFGCTIHLLDDGFQHVQLARDVDLLLVSPEDLGERVLPAGRLREPLTSAAAADAVLVPGSAAEAATIAGRLGVAKAFGLTTAYGAPRAIEPFGEELPRMAGTRVLAVAGIARPNRFFEALHRQGCEIAKTLVFGDHHRFDTSDLKMILATARSVGAVQIMTTEKDAMRMLDLPLGPIPRTLAFLPMSVEVDPRRSFAEWLRARLVSARRAGRA